MSKILNYYTSRQWNLEVAKSTGNLTAAIVYGQLLHHYDNMGEFSKTDEQISREINISLRTFKRNKKLLIDNGFISIKNSHKNISIYKIVKKFEYFDRSYRKYDINYCKVSKNNNSGILLGHLIYLDNYFISKGEINFYKTNECLQEELFMSPRELKAAKKNLIERGFISVTRGAFGRSYYKIHNDQIFKDIAHNAQMGQNDTERGPKRTVQVGQNAPSYINIQDNIHNILLFYLLLPQSLQLACAHKEKEIKKRKSFDKDNLKEFRRTDKMDELTEIYKMIGFWKEKIPGQDVYISQTLIKKLQEILKNKFQNSLDAWKDYVERISQNDYLTGKTNPNWIPRISWFCEPNTVDRVIGGYFGGNVDDKKSSKISKIIAFTEEELINEVMEKSYDPDIQKGCLTIIDHMRKNNNKGGLSSYQSHLRNAQFNILRQKGKKILVINAFYGSYISLIPYHNIVINAFKNFDDILIFSGANDRRGDYIYMETDESEFCEREKMGMI